MSETIQPAFSLRAFAPGWGASVMGTGALAIGLWSLAQHEARAEFVRPAATAFFWLTLVLGILVLGTTLARWIRFPGAAIADLHHPVKGGMSATGPGAVLVIAMAVGRIGADAWGSEQVRGVVLALTLFGGIIAVVFGIVFLAGIFASGATPLGAITGAWFIPPVVTVLIPTSLAPLVAAAESTAAFDRELLSISWAALGMGTVLYLVITAALFFRTATTPLPPAPLAPTLIIGMGPAGLIGLDLVALAQATVRHGALAEEFIGFAAAVGLVFWGFGLWWALTALVVILRGYPPLPFGLPWWGFTFPLGAWTVAGFVLASAAGSLTVFWIALTGLILLVGVWLVTAARTLAGIANRSIWSG